MKKPHVKSRIPPSAAQLKALIQKIKNDMPHGVTITEDATGVNIHFAIYTDGPDLIEPKQQTKTPPPKIIHL